jgi:hypothetical protein
VAQCGCATYLDHDGHLAQLSDELLGLAIVDAVFHNRRELAAIRDVPFSALGREDLAPLGKLVGRRNLRPLKRDTLVPDRQLVFACRRCPVIPVEECLRPNLGQRMIEEAGSVVVLEERVEGLDVRVDGQLEGGIGRFVGRGVPEELLAAYRVVLVVPRRVCPFGRHVRLLQPED